MDTDAQGPSTPEGAGLPLRFRENGALVAAGGIVVGRVALPLGIGTQPTLVLDLGWMRAAGVRLQVIGDREVDRQRSGIVLER